MSKSRQPKKQNEKDPGPVLFIRLDDATEAALQAFIEAQTVPPDRSSVGRKALRDFLRAQGFWPLKDGAT